MELGSDEALGVRIAKTGAEYAATSAAVFPLMLLVRLYELVIVRAAHTLPPGSGEAIARGGLHDLVTSAWIALALLPTVAIGLFSPRLGRILHRVGIALAIVIATGLAQYFAITFVPLGADLFGYSLADIRETTTSSKGIGVLTFLPFGVAALVSWVVCVQARRISLGQRTRTSVLAVLAIAVCGSSFLDPEPQQFDSDTPYFLSVNKTAYFVSGSVHHFADRRALNDVAMSLTGYPLLHPATDEDVLGPLLTVAKGKPNIVMVIVEGLGRDFVGDGAQYGGFTPFLDSLAGKSLYWPNYMSVAGRTFGVLPAILGSLPFGETGFMELGRKMPRHVSLVSLLKEQGYLTSFFTGTDGHFDNIDVFLERQGIDRLIDASNFGPSYARQPADDGGSSWGYGDQDLFRRAFEEIGTRESRPRLDIYLTITTHEPFKPPRTAEYMARFRKRLASLNVDGAKRAEYEQYAGIFSSLMYLDDGIRSFIGEYAKRPDADRTIIIITGDHRLIPIPPRARLDRYHVPFIIYSPLVKEPRRFSSVSSHIDVTPSILALLKQNYGVTSPAQVSWLGTGIDTNQAFRSTHSVALMKVKGQLDEYLDGEHFLSGDRLFKVSDGLVVTEVSDRAAQSAAMRKLAAFIQLNRFVTTGDHLFPGGNGDTTNVVVAHFQDSVFSSLGLDAKTPTDAFNEARRLAFAGRYDLAQTILKKQLRDIPNFHDARALLGRTYAWSGKRDTASALLEDLVRRAPNYPDGFSAQIDVEIWENRPDAALRKADSAIARFPSVGDLRVGKAKALELLGRKREALAALDAIRAGDPAAASAAVVRKRLLQ